MPRSQARDRMRVEKDALGTIQVPCDAYWGAATQRSIENFPIGREVMPPEIIRALVIIKKACALTNLAFHVLSPKKCEAICQACDEILLGKFPRDFPLLVWQTGSGTQSNMNVNEVIANRANELIGGKKGDKSPVHPNDDVNASQSSNDTFPTAMHLAATFEISERLLPATNDLYETMKKKAKKFSGIVKVGRTHLMDAVPITLGQEFSGYAAQLDFGLCALKQSLKLLRELAIGATAVGTGINAPKGFSEQVVAAINTLTGYTFTPARNTFAALASHEAMVATSGALKQLATSLFKIANDIRWLASGPRAGLGELLLPENEPGSSIMPGKVNPTQTEAMTMVAIQVIGNDTAIGMAGCLGNFELNVFKPLIAYNLLQSIRLLADGIESFDIRCVSGIAANIPRIKHLLDHSLAQAVALSPVLGYDKTAQIVRKAHLEQKSLKQAARELELVSDKEADTLLDPKNMLHPK